VLRPYSDAMERVLRRGGTNAGHRALAYTMRGTAFARDAGGSISHNIVTASNTASNDGYARYCRARASGWPPNPAMSCSIGEPVRAPATLTKPR
jgi:hypothetical protein